MARIVYSMMVSLDGYIAGPSADGDMDELQAWVMRRDSVDTEILERGTHQPLVGKLPRR